MTKQSDSFCDVVYKAQADNEICRDYFADETGFIF